jgi:thioredoxin:protein disulfide reductase
MNRTLASVFALAAVLGFSNAALADTATLSAECEWKASIECQASCAPTASYLQCDIDPPECTAKIPTECSAEASASCDLTSCQASCEGECTAKPATFSCFGQCQASVEAECTAKIDANCTATCDPANIDATCTGRCTTSANKAECEGACKAKLQAPTCKTDCQGDLSATCKGSGKADCEGKCSGSPGSVDCKGSCTASCQGGCDAHAKATCNGYLNCKSAGKISCETDFAANCKGSCQTEGGGLYCNGRLVKFGNLDSVKAWFQAHGYAEGSSSSKCSGNTCEAEAEGKAGVTCAASRAPGSASGPGAIVAAGLLSLAYAGSRLRRRKLAGELHRLNRSGGEEPEGRGCPRSPAWAIPGGVTKTRSAPRPHPEGSSNDSSAPRRRDHEQREGAAGTRRGASIAGALALLAALSTLMMPTLAWGSEPAGDAFTQALNRGPLFAGLAAMVGGFLVSLTPCVYPMIAITVSVFGAREAKSRWEAAGLSTVFVLGIAAMFTPMGMLAGLTGSAFGTALANKWVVIGISLIFLALAANLFGAFEFVLPDSLTQRLASVGGVGYGGAFVLGLVSGVVAAPCTGPVLTGILVWIGKTQSVAQGAAALFAFSMGLGVPFWLVGTFAVKLPKSGRWMVHVKSVFGIVMVVAALYFLRNAFPALAHLARPTTAFALGAAGTLVVGLLLGAVHLSFDDGGAIVKARKVTGIAAAVTGTFLLVGWAQAPRGELSWLHAEEEAKQLAVSSGKPMMIDFTATWCGACQELAKHTFTDPRVQAEASRFVAVKVDATNEDDPKVEATMKRYAVRGLPTVVLLDSHGKEAHRFVDFVEADAFYKVIKDVE